MWLVLSPCPAFPDTHRVFFVWNRGGRGLDCDLCVAPLWITHGTERDGTGRDGGKSCSNIFFVLRGKDRGYIKLEGGRGRGWGDDDPIRTQRKEGLTQKTNENSKEKHNHCPTNKLTPPQTLPLCSCWTLMQRRFRWDCRFSMSWRTLLPGPSLDFLVNILCQIGYGHGGAV